MLSKVSPLKFTNCQTETVSLTRSAKKEAQKDKRKACAKTNDSRCRNPVDHIQCEAPQPGEGGASCRGFAASLRGRRQDFGRLVVCLVEVGLCYPGK